MEPSDDFRGSRGPRRAPSIDANRPRRYNSNTEPRARGYVPKLQFGPQPSGGLLELSGSPTSASSAGSARLSAHGHLPQSFPTTPRTPEPAGHSASASLPNTPASRPHSLSQPHHHHGPHAHAHAHAGSQSPSLATVDLRTMPVPPRTRSMAPLVDRLQFQPGPDVSIIRVVQYNVLADTYATEAVFGYCKRKYLSWAYRSVSILRELLAYDAAILCLQEVDHFEDFFQPQLRKYGYKGYYYKRPGSKRDGCAIFFKRDLFTLLETTELDFNDLAKPAAKFRPSSSFTADPRSQTTSPSSSQPSSPAAPSTPAPPPPLDIQLPAPSAPTAVPSQGPHPPSDDTPRQSLAPAARDFTPERATLTLTPAAPAPAASDRPVRGSQLVSQLLNLSLLEAGSPLPDSARFSACSGGLSARGPLSSGGDPVESGDALPSARGDGSEPLISVRSQSLERIRIAEADKYRTSNVAFGCFLRSNTSGAGLWVVNTHLYWDPQRSDVKLAQASMLRQHLADIREVYGDKVGFILCGDLNSKPEDPAYRVLVGLEDTTIVPNAPPALDPLPVKDTPGRRPLSSQRGWNVISGEHVADTEIASEGGEEPAEHTAADACRLGRRNSADSTSDRSSVEEDASSEGSASGADADLSAGSQPPPSRASSLGLPRLQVPVAPPSPLTQPGPVHTALLKAQSAPQSPLLSPVSARPPPRPASVALRSIYHYKTEPAYTNYTQKFVGTLDYIFCSPDVFAPICALTMPPIEELKAEVALPNALYSSDHIALVCDLQMKNHPLPPQPCPLGVRCRSPRCALTHPQPCPMGMSCNQSACTALHLSPCKFGITCQVPNCSYNHLPCRAGPCGEDCKDSKCLYSHLVKCKFGKVCNRSECHFYHPGRAPAPSPPAQMPPQPRPLAMVAEGRAGPHIPSAFVTPRERGPSTHSTPRQRPQDSPQTRPPPHSQPHAHTGQHVPAFFHSAINVNMGVPMQSPMQPGGYMMPKSGPAHGQPLTVLMSGPSSVVPMRAVPNGMFSPAAVQAQGSRQ